LRDVSMDMEAGLTQSLSPGEKAVLIAQLKGLVAQAEKI
jgi:hypothetical protein